jgi:FkbM family methyltransferase
VVDVGANTGVFTMYAAARTNGRVIAVEPFPDFVQSLEKTLESNQVSNVEVHRAALSGLSGETRLWFGEMCPSTCCEKGAGQKRLEVKAITFRQIVDSVVFVDLLKIDCEGAEYDILKSMSLDDANRVRKIVMEYHSFTGHEPSELKTDLRRLGYEYEEQNESSQARVGYIWAKREPRKAGKMDSPSDPRVP